MYVKIIIPMFALYSRSDQLLIIWTENNVNVLFSTTHVHTLVKVHDLMTLLLFLGFHVLVKLLWKRNLQ